MATNDSRADKLSPDTALQLERFRSHLHTEAEPRFQDTSVRYGDNAYYTTDEILPLKVNRCRSVVECHYVNCSKTGWVDRLETPDQVLVIGGVQVGYTT